MDPTLLSSLLSAGPYGLATVAFLVAAWAIKRWMEEARGRLDDQKVMGAQLMSVSLSLSEQTRANEIRNDAFEESIKLQALTGAAVTTNAVNIGAVSEKLTTLATEVARTREALIHRGVIGQ